MISGRMRTVAVLGVVLAITLGACGSSADTTTAATSTTSSTTGPDATTTTTRPAVPSTPPTTAASPTTTGAPSPAPAAPAAEVQIVDVDFSPRSVQVAAGQTVRWSQTGNLTHTVTSAGFDSGTLSKGETYQITPTTPGTISYVCTIHSSMQGTIVVTG